MDGHADDETVHYISLCWYGNNSSSTNRKLKETSLKDIVAAVCAMLNSKGGKVMLLNDCKCNLSFPQMTLVIRILEQSMVSIIGTQQTVSKINFIEDKDGVVVIVKKGCFLVTTNYNLYIPSETQVLLVSPLEPLENVQNVINRKVIQEPVEICSHHKIFFLNKMCGFQESKVVMFKHLKASPSKRTRLADRMTSKGNRFSHYVSAFANYSGGHMYFGITDVGVVVGELIPKEEDITEIVKKVEKAIKKMTWAEQIGQPKRGGHWDIFFEPVVDENSKPIPSTFVIVIYIAACVGGVFTEEPECYEMVEGKVNKMSLITWMKRITGTDQVVSSISHEIRIGITWVSKTIQKLCIRAFCILTTCLDNGDLEAFEDNSKKIRNMFPNIVELDLIVLLKEIIAKFRKQHFTAVDKLLKKYDERLPNATEHRMFQVLGLCVRVAVARLKRDLNLLIFALAKAEWLSPGLVTALVYFCAGTVTAVSPVHKFSPVFLGPDEFTIKALQHIQIISDYPAVRADLECKAHITLAMFHLGCNISGELITEHVDDDRLKQARCSVMAIDRDSGNFTYYRKVQLNLVKSIHSFRCSENQPEERMHFMREALEYSKQSENLARKLKFYEMVSWSKSLQSLYVEKLLRAKLAQIKRN